MATKSDWEKLIISLGGKIGGGVTTTTSSEFIDGNWFHYNRGDEKKKPIRDRVAREMRKDKWEVKTETNSLGYFIRAKRRK